jgi:hypothetical protein
MNNIIQVLTIGGLAILIIASRGGITTQQQLTYASMDSETGNNGNEEEEGQLQQEEGCSTTPATSPDLEGWTIETCGNGDVTWISPSGTRCVGNEASGNLACNNMVAKGYNIK